MSNDALSRTEILLLLNEICMDAAKGQGEGYPSAWERLSERLDVLPAHHRAQVDAAIREILRFQPPPTRATQ